MVGSVGAGRFFLCTLRDIFCVDLGTDALILTFRELIAQLVQHILQMLLQGFILEMLFDGYFHRRSIHSVMST